MPKTPDSASDGGAMGVSGHNPPIAEIQYDDGNFDFLDNFRELPSQELQQDLIRAPWSRRRKQPALALEDAEETDLLFAHADELDQVPARKLL